MKTLALGVLACVSLFSTTSRPLQPGQANPANTQASCGRFVLAFYDWYAANVFAKLGGWLEPLLHEKRSAFSPEFLRVLEEFSRRPLNEQAAIDNLDFDPILHAQDTEDAYVIGKITRKGDRYFVEVFSVSAGQRNPQPDVIPELTFKDGHWLFTNFHYDSQDLISILHSTIKESKHAGEQAKTRGR
jgi:hypothetical protein